MAQLKVEYYSIGQGKDTFTVLPNHEAARLFADSLIDARAGYVKSVTEVGVEEITYTRTVADWGFHYA